MTIQMRKKAHRWERYSMLKWDRRLTLMIAAITTVMEDNAFWEATPSQLRAQVVGGTALWPIPPGPLSAVLPAAPVALRTRCLDTTPAWVLGAAGSRRIHGSRVSSRRTKRQTRASMLQAWP